MGGAIGDIHFASSSLTKSEKTAHVFPAAFAGTQVDIDYFSCLFIKRVVCQADELIKIEVVISKPELWFESESKWCGASLPFQFLDKSLIAGLALRSVDGSRSKLIFW
jgi:hypothetical protein